MAATLASGLARGLSVPDAVGLAKRYIVEAVRNSYPLGAGHGPVSPLWTVRPWWEDGVPGRSDEHDRAHLGNAP